MQNHPKKCHEQFNHCYSSSRKSPMSPMMITLKSAVILSLARLTTQNTVLQPLYVTTYPPATEIGRSRVDSAIQWLTISIDGEITITNFYKPPNSPFDSPPQCEHPAIYSGDFNCHHTTWGYSRNNHDREALHDWSNTIDLKLLYNHNQPKTFYSAAWDTYTNRDLTFFTHDTDSSLPHPEHSVLGNFPKSQHRPTIIYHPALIEYTQTSSLPR